MRKMRVLFCILLLPVLITGCFRGKITPREDIYAYVESNVSLLEKVISMNREVLAENNGNRQYCRSLLGRKTVAEYIYIPHYSDIVIFECRGVGFSGGGTDTGFYYSPSNTPSDMNWYNIELVEISPGVYEWENKDQLQRLRTERIIDNWFYYIEEQG